MKKIYIILNSGIVIIVVAAVLATVLVLVLKDDDTESSLPPEVELKNGKVFGKIEYSRHRNVAYYSFKGIPFAQPPVGNLRFSPPVPAEPWNGTLNATEYGSKCVQFSGSGGSEDCLTINVFTPSLTEKNLTVMVWVYGGAFIAGSVDYYTPCTIMEEKDIILVTFNYRVGIFGFFSTEDEVASGNQGLKDQILALKWVHENIAQFGGSPDKVTLFGESAGAASISYLLQTPLTTGLFRAAIMQSGCTLNLWSLGRGKKKALLEAARVLGIEATDSPTLLEEFRKIPYQNLSITTSTVDLSQMITGNPFNGLLFSPSIEPESNEAVITGSSYEKMKNGQFQQVPMIVGFNSEEGLMFYDSLDVFLTYLITYKLFPQRLVPISMNVQDDLKRKVGTIIKSEYFKSSFNNTEEKMEVTRFISEHQFERGIHKYVEFSSKYVPVYYYKFSYYDGDRTILGAAHGEELDHLFGAEYSAITPKMVKLWTNFAKHLNPTVKVDSKLEHTTWLSYNESKSYLDISTSLSIMTGEVYPRISFWDDLYKEYGNEPFDTY